MVTSYCPIAVLKGFLEKNDKDNRKTESQDFGKVTKCDSYSILIRPSGHLKHGQEHLLLKVD